MIEDHASQRVTAKGTPPVPARKLFGSRREIHIEFRGEIYRLRITRNEKLILTK
ncbi:MAG: hemin uptake protein HemP [Pseudomonadota bacterium]